MIWQTGCPVSWATHTFCSYMWGLLHGYAYSNQMFDVKISFRLNSPRAKLTHYNVYVAWYYYAKYSYIFEIRETNLTSWQQSSVHSCFCDVFDNSNFCQKPSIFGLAFRARGLISYRRAKTLSCGCIWNDWGKFNNSLLTKTIEINKLACFRQENFLVQICAVSYHWREDLWGAKVWRLINEARAAK